MRSELVSYSEKFTLGAWRTDACEEVLGYSSIEDVLFIA